MEPKTGAGMGDPNPLALCGRAGPEQLSDLLTLDRPHRHQPHHPAADTPTLELPLPRGAELTESSSYKNTGYASIQLLLSRFYRLRPRRC